MEKINTQNYEDTIKQVLIDDRETARADYAMQQYKTLNPKVEHLKVGDYIFKGKDKSVCFEYKTGTDFLSSTIDSNHLHNQVWHMTQEYDYTCVMVTTYNLERQVQELYYTRGINVNLSRINGIIAELNTVTTVVLCQTQYQAFDEMMRFAGKIIQNKPFKYSWGKKSSNTALNYLSSITGLDTKAENIVKKLKLKTHEDLMNVTYKDLITVELVGDKTARAVLEELGRPYEN